MFIHGAELVVAESWDMSQLLRALGRLLQIHVKRVFNAEGLEFDDISMLTDGDHVFCSDGDEFRSPMSHKSSRNLWNTQAATSRNAASSIPHGTVVAGYKVGRVLGQGGFGCVRLGQHLLTGQLVALKFLSKSLFASATDADRVITEISCLTDLEHPNIIKLQGVHQEAGSMVIALDFAPGGDLKAYLLRKGGKLTEEDARQKFTQILRGIQYAHNRGIAHRDLKLENVLMGPKDVCLITDFGLSQYAARDEKTASSGGSLFYLAPELVHGDLSNGQQVDVWCLGVMLYLLLVGELPFMSPAISAAMKKLKDEAAAAPDSLATAAEIHGGADVEGDHHSKAAGGRDFFMEACRLVDHRSVFKEVKKCICAGRFIIPDILSAPAADLLVSILRQKPTNRLTIGEIFAHPWIRSTNVFQAQGDETSSDVGSLFGFSDVPKPSRTHRPPISIPPAIDTVGAASTRLTALSPTLSPEPVKSPGGARQSCKSWKAMRNGRHSVERSCGLP
jgi:serine/threonine protein kinase